ncbi:MAG: hypothetical protein JRD68_04330 [Deltaproteobacteria bacterium]|nr:hypothetical protein [Deltaproteobacteria bacterium]
MPVIDFELKSKRPYVGGRTFGEAGVYDSITGVLTFAVDPENDSNAFIVDLNLAPREENGCVCFRADFKLLTPADPSRANGRVIIEPPNRGNRMILANFNRLLYQDQASGEFIPGGDGFLFQRGYSVVSIGWQWDVYRDQELLGFEPPYAIQDDRPIKGKTIVEIRPNTLEYTRLLANRIHKPYPAFDLTEQEATLLVRDFDNDEARLIPRSDWRFARKTENGIEPSRKHVYLKTGFEPGKIYQVIYTTEGAPVAGAGLLAIRDVASFLRYDDSDLNPAALTFNHAYGFGISQTGRVLRHLIYLGLNIDEEGRMVYDGILAHIAGSLHGGVNHRFAQPSDSVIPTFSYLFPFADNTVTDPLTGRTDGLLEKLRERDAVPRIMYTNTATEYWRGDGSLIHININGGRDLEPAPESRIYHFAGTRHGTGSLPLTNKNPTGEHGRHGFNIVDYTPLLRAALTNLDQWASENVEPPPSIHPRLDDGTAVDRREVIATFENNLAVPAPDPEKLRVTRTIDLGPEAGQGIGRYPMIQGEAYPCFVSAVDDDGNELAGIRLPDITVPAATHMGWNLRAPEIGAPEQMLSLQGSSIFLAKSKFWRENSNDQRPSLEERYQNREEYLKKVRSETEKLVSERYLLAEDVELVVGNAAARYDAAINASE